MTQLTRANYTNLLTGRLPACSMAWPFFPSKPMGGRAVACSPGTLGPFTLGARVHGCLELKHHLLVLEVLHHCSRRLTFAG